MSTSLSRFYNSRKKSIGITVVVAIVIILTVTVIRTCFISDSHNPSFYQSYVKNNLTFIALISPLFIWLLYFFLWKKSEPEPVAIENEKDFFKGCHQIIHYFDLVGKNIATVPLAEIYKTDPSFVPNSQLVKLLQDVNPPNPPSVYGENISSGLAYLEAKTSPLDPTDKTTLTLIYDYLSIALSIHDNDITVETVTEAMDRDLVKKANFNYTFGAIYVVLFTVVCHSYLNSIANDAAETKRVLATYSSLLHTTSIHDTIKSEIKVGDSTKQVARDTLRLTDSIVSHKALLLLRTKWLHNDIAAYPVPSVGGKDPNITFLFKFDSTVSPLAAELQGINWLYLSDQIIDDMKMYILPILYGLLGSFLFVIRKLFDQAKNFDLTVKKLARHRVRILFGLFVGIFFGYLFTSTENQRITTFVYAFIGGYNVELLFTVMDKIISTFTSTTTEAKNDKKAK